MLDLRRESKQLPQGAGVTGKSEKLLANCPVLFIHKVCTEKDFVLPDQKTKQRTPKHSQPLINFFMQQPIIQGLKTLAVCLGQGAIIKPFGKNYLVLINLEYQYEDFKRKF